MLRIRFIYFVLLAPIYLAAKQDTIVSREILIEKSRLQNFVTSGIDKDVFRITTDDALDAANRKGRKLAEVLSELPGIHLKNYGAGQLSSIAINGTSASQTNLYWNGIKLNSPALGQNDFSLLTNGGCEQISIVRGGYNGTIGGSIFLQDDILHSKKMEHDITLRYSSFQSLDLLSNSKYTNRFFKGITNASYSRSDNNFSFQNISKKNHPREVQQHAATNQWSLSQQFLFTISKQVQLGANIWITQAQRELPPTITQEKSAQYQRDEAYRTMLFLIGKSGWLQYSIKSAYMRDNLRYTDKPLSIDSRMQIDVVRNLFSLESSFKKWELTAQLHYDFEQVISSGFSQKKQRNLYGVYAFATYNFWKEMKVKLALKQEFNGIQPLAFSPALSLLYIHKIKSKSALQISLEASRAYRLPSMNDLYWAGSGNANLRTEKSWNAGVYLQANYQHWIQIKFSNHYALVSDWILWHPNANGQWSPDNLKRVFTRGINILLKTQSRENITDKHFSIVAYASYAFTKAENLDAISENDNSKNKQLIYVPLHQVTTTFQLQFHQFYVRSIHQFTGTQFTSTDNTESLPAFYLTHLEVGKNLHFNSQQLSLSFRIQNLTDNSYQVVAQRPMPGRSFEGTIRLNLVKE